MAKSKPRAPVKSPRSLSATIEVPSASAGSAPLLAEALRRAEETRNVVEDTLVGFGRWLFVHVFESDVAAALDGKRRPPVWNELLQRAGGPSLRLSRRFLSVALRIAAYDHRIQDESWRLLEPGRKELLLPLAEGTEERPLREAAQHVVSLKLSHRATRLYVKNLRAPGKGRAAVLSPETARRDLARFSARVADVKYEKRFAKLARTLDDERRAELKTELARVRAWAVRQLRVLDGKEP